MSEHRVDYTNQDGRTIKDGLLFRPQGQGTLEITEIDGSYRTIYVGDTNGKIMVYVPRYNSCDSGTAVLRYVFYQNPKSRKQTATYIGSRGCPGMKLRLVTIPFAKTAPAVANWQRQYEMDLAQLR